MPTLRAVVAMTKVRSLPVVAAGTVLSILCAKAVTGPDKYAVRVENGLAFSEFRGYEDWPVIAISENGGKIAAILGNPVMIDAYRNGAPGDGKLFPDGARMAKIHWTPRKQEAYPGEPIVPGAQHDVDFMVKDAKRFADSGGWGWAAFEYDEASGAFRPATGADNPPQERDAKCGFACHTLVQSRDYVFTEYGQR